MEVCPLCQVGGAIPSVSPFPSLVRELQEVGILPLALQLAPQAVGLLLGQTGGPEGLVSSPGCWSSDVNAATY